ncbi:hypothetical protein [Streptomyces panaciradicis]|uniref:hypothetical protein n=1 Tax=Streptomyces panaciradicis TaxID=1470261 RepID=UPI00201D23FC|nr:hypothetical protein [Streptomyces panaciradicis]MCL6675263.1 hypothetical protein [Streptomyces panaciradicis]
MSASADVAGAVGRALETDPGAASAVVAHLLDPDGTPDPLPPASYSKDGFPLL